jgi:hypothetical protein
LLFGSLLVIDGSDIAWAAGAGVAVLVATYLVGPRWTATGFDPSAARSLGVRSGLPDAAPAGARRTRRRRGAVGRRCAAGHRAARPARGDHAAGLRPAWGAGRRSPSRSRRRRGIAGLWLSVELNAPPGPAIAVLAGGVFAVVAGWRAHGVRRSAALAAGAALHFSGGRLRRRGVGGGGVRAVVTTTQLGDITRAIRAAAARVTPDPQAQHRSPQYEPPARRHRSNRRRPP